MSKDIFISHVKANESVALAIANLLEAEGYTTYCFSRGDFYGGVSYTVQDIEEVAGSKAFLVVLSPDVNSGPVEAELHEAFRTRKPIFPVLYGITSDQLRKGDQYKNVVSMIGTFPDVPMIGDDANTIKQKLLDGLIRANVLPRSRRNSKAKELEALVDLASLEHY